MSTVGLVSRNTFMALLGFMFVLAAAPSAWSEESNQMAVQKSGSSDSVIMAHALMTGHIAEALDAQKRKDLKGAAMHAQMAIKAGESVQGAVGSSKVDPGDVKNFNEGIESLKEALQKAQSGDSEGFEKATLTAMDKTTTKCHGAGCQTVACGCGVQLSPTCDPLHPTKKCRTVGCNCYCM